MWYKTSFAKMALGLLGSLALSSSAISATATPGQIATRLLAQEGLAIAFASTVLQTQLGVLIEVTVPQPLTCQSGGGYSVLVVSRTDTNGVIDVKMKYFFDTACKNVFAVATMKSQFTPGAFHLTGQVAYRDSQSVPVGTLAINEHAYGTGDTVDTFELNSVAGLGTFTPINGRPAVSLGLTCRKLSQLYSTPTPCEGGVAQSFPKLGVSLGSVSPLQLNLATTPLTFSGTSSTMGEAPIGTLSLGLPTPTYLGLVGNYTTFASSSASGEAGTFSLFPPKPTDWTVTDVTHHQKFSIHVASSTLLNSVGTVVNTNTNAVLATIAVDQSGTGTILYADGSKPPVTSWTLGD